MATGAAPALDPKPNSETETPATSEKPLTLKDRIFRKLSQIFEHNERLGVTRP
jgi:hypothetical protein